MGGKQERRTEATIFGSEDVPAAQVNARLQVDVITAPSSGDTEVVGNVAHGSPDSGFPVKIGMKTVNHGADPTSVDPVGDRTDWYANQHGVPWVIGGHPNVRRLTANYTGVQTDAVLLTVGTNEKFVVTECSAFVDKACTVNVSVLFEFSTGTRFAQHPGIAAGSGFVEGNGSGMLAIGAATDDVTVSVSVPTGGSVTVAVSGYLITEA